MLKKKSSVWMLQKKTLYNLKHFLISQKHTDAILKFTYHISFSLSNASPLATAVLVHTWLSGPIQGDVHMVWPATATYFPRNIVFEHT